VTPAYLHRPELSVDGGATAIERALKGRWAFWKVRYASQNKVGAGVADDLVI
jgi:hypothetical protein